MFSANIAVVMPRPFTQNDSFFRRCMNTGLFAASLLTNWIGSAATIENDPSVTLKFTSPASGSEFKRGVPIHLTGLKSGWKKFRPAFFAPL